MVNKIIIMTIISVTAILLLCSTLWIVLKPQGERARIYKSCSPRSFGYDSFVCVCNSSYCDEFPPVPLDIEQHDVVCYTTTRAGKRFHQEVLSMEPVDPTDLGHIGYLNISISTKYQKMKGFGGAFTDAAGINILSLDEEAAENLLKSYYSPQGIEYNVGRIPMAGCDFSTHAYTYNDNKDDFSMSKFALQAEDLQYKIPLIKRAMSMNQKNMSFFGSPWTAPAWMKDSNSYIGAGSLIGIPGGQYYQAWALYFSKFIEEYKKQGVSMWGLTAQNEPFDGQIEDFPFQCLGFTAEQQRDFIKLDLGPTLDSHEQGEVKLMILDDQRLFMEAWTQTVLSDPEAAKYIDGIAVHWYTDYITPPGILSRTHDAFPSKFLFGSEACAGEIPFGKNHVKLGSWFRGQRYSLDMIQDLEHWVSGWVDWNLALDMEGGPNWVSNFVDALIIVNNKTNEFYKQPSFYHMGHFSKFVLEDSYRILTTRTNLSGSIRQVAFLLPDGKTRVLVAVNIGDEDEQVFLYDNATKNAANTTLQAESIKTFIWK